MKHEALGKYKEASKLYDSLLEKDPLNQPVLRRKCILARTDRGNKARRGEADRVCVCRPESSRCFDRGAERQTSVSF